MREIDRTEELERVLAEDEPAPAAVQALPLDAHRDRLVDRDLSGWVFIGCHAARDLAGAIVERGGLMIPNIDGFTFPSHRARLYAPEELFDGFDASDPAGYHQTFDYRVYEEYRRHGNDGNESILVTLARRLHDHSITDALNEVIRDRQVVGVMGGHGMERADEFYAKVARLSRRLTRLGFLMVSGGGPGAMEATHLGAYFAARDDADLEAALDMLGRRPPGAPKKKEYADPDWLHRAWAVRERFPIPTGNERASMSVGVPTWLYGHEPPAPFATHIAKYFANSVREDGLLTIAKQGIVYAPGSAGTTQEIFQDVTQNQYGTVGVISPMILFGREHWTKTRPVWPLLSQLAVGHMYGELLALTDDEGEVVRRIRMFEPDLYRTD